MLTRIYEKLKSRGISGLLKAPQRCPPLPQRLEYYPQCKSVFESGIGLEIGGPSGMFRPHGFIPIYSIAARIDNCNFNRQTVWEGDILAGDTFIFNAEKAPGRQYIREASNLEGIEDSSYAYVLSAHCLEHLANPLKCLAEWIRVLKHDGLLVLVVPYKGGTFDHRRPVTTLEHLIQDLEDQTDEGDMTHLDEILSLHDLSKDPGAGDFESFRQRSERNVENRCLHHHVFDTRLAVEVVNYVRLQILAVEFFQPYHIIIIAKKVGKNQPVNNEIFRGIDKAP